MATQHPPSPQLMKHLLPPQTAAWISLIVPPCFMFLWQKSFGSACKAWNLHDLDCIREVTERETERESATQAKDFIICWQAVPTSCSQHLQIGKLYDLISLSFNVAGKTRESTVSMAYWGSFGPPASIYWLRSGKMMTCLPPYRILLFCRSLFLQAKRQWVNSRHAHQNRGGHAAAILPRPPNLFLNASPPFCSNLSSLVFRVLYYSSLSFDPQLYSLSFYCSSFPSEFDMSLSTTSSVLV